MLYIFYSLCQAHEPQQLLQESEAKKNKDGRLQPKAMCFNGAIFFSQKPCAFNGYTCRVRSDINGSHDDLLTQSHQRMCYTYEPTKDSSTFSIKVVSECDIQSTKERKTEKQSI